MVAVGALVGSLPDRPNQPTNQHIGGIEKKNFWIKASHEAQLKCLELTHWVS